MADTQVPSLSATVLMSACPNVSQGAMPEDAAPLRIHPDNPRYFAASDGRVVWLTGSHTWANLQEPGVEGETPDFDDDGYLDFL